MRSIRDVVIVSFARTPIGSMGGLLASVPAPALGSTAIRGALKRAGEHLKASSISEVIMGNVVSAGVGQAPARQAARGAGVSDSAVCLTVNKVCASGMKALALGAASISVGASDVVVAGGMESMSCVPFYSMGARAGLRLGHSRLLDGVIHDGLWDAYGDMHMGSCAEKTVRDMKISRVDQDAWALRSYARAKAAAARAAPAADIEPVTVKGARGAETLVSTDEEPPRGADAAKLASLKPAFVKVENGGTITAANASKLNDGAAALVLMDAALAKSLGIAPIARVLGYADAEAAPVDFSTAPSLAVPRALSRAGVAIKDVALHEINEAFSSVVLANIELLKIDADRVNVNGGAVALGHPIGASGARIVGSLITSLGELGKGSIGVASICNGGGGASAFVVERL
jgi:acetyl-CoA C-acetyltransferase